jgi:hypothetical protein
MPYLLWVMVLPAFCLGAATNPVRPLAFLFFYKEEATDLASLFRGLFGYMRWWTLPSLFVAVLAFVSVDAGRMEAHLKSGRFGFKKPFKRINDAFPAVFFSQLFMFVFLALYILLDSGLLALVHIIFSSSGMPPTTFELVVAVVIQIALFAFVALLFPAVLMFVPCSLILGYPLRESASCTVRMFRDVWFKLFAAVLVPLLIGFVPISILMLYDVPAWIVSAVCMVFYLFAGHYYFCLAFTAFYDLTGAERRDNLRGFHIIK